MTWNPRQAIFEDERKMNATMSALQTEGYDPLLGKNDMLIWKKDAMKLEDFLHPQSLTWNLKTMVSKSGISFSRTDFQVNHVKLHGCICKYWDAPPPSNSQHQDYRTL